MFVISFRVLSSKPKTVIDFHLSLKHPKVKHVFINHSSRPSLNWTMDSFRMIRKK